MKKNSEYSTFAVRTLIRIVLSIIEHLERHIKWNWLLNIQACHRIIYTRNRERERKRDQLYGVSIMDFLAIGICTRV